MQDPIRVLFLCTHNSARSQMAEAWLRHEGGVKFSTASAGIEPGKVHPLTRQVMAEAGLDIHEARSKSLHEFAGGQPFDYLITVCSNAEEQCPFFPGQGQRLHWPFDDPSAITGGEEERLEAFRRASDQIRRQIVDWLATQPSATRPR